MKERELTESHDGIYRAGSWDAIGLEPTNPNDEIMIELTMESTNYIINPIKRITKIGDITTVLKISALPCEFLDKPDDADAGFEDDNYLLFITLDKPQEGPNGKAGKIQIPSGLKIKAGGQPYFIALHVDGGNTDKKYKRKTETLVGDHIPMFYIPNALVG